MMCDSDKVGVDGERIAVVSLGDEVPDECVDLSWRASCYCKDLPNNQIR